jgi:multiple sugar transport system ATP-binding protein
VNVAEVKIEDVSVQYARNWVLQNINFEVAESELCVLVGPSGCGKTVLLRTVAGLTRPNRGQVYFDGEPVDAVPPAHRDVAMCFQTYALYPYMTVRQNWEFPLRTVSLPEDQIQQRVTHVVELTHMQPLMDRRPKELSGGQQQRVALGRALVRRPRVFLLDEPFGNLDAKLRVELRARVKRLQMDLGITTLHVTHDQVEAQAMADKMVVMDVGTVQQVGTPEEIYESPANLFVASFIGTPRINLFPCQLTQDGGPLTFVCPAFELPAQVGRLETGTSSSHVVVGIRPEKVSISTSPLPGSFPAEVFVTEPQSNELIVGLTAKSTTFKSRFPAAEIDFEPQIDQTLHATFETDFLHVFDDESQQRIT